MLQIFYRSAPPPTPPLRRYSPLITAVLAVINTFTILPTCPTYIYILSLFVLSSSTRQLDVRGFTLSDVLGKPWSQLPSLLPHGTGHHVCRASIGRVHHFQFSAFFTLVDFHRTRYQLTLSRFPLVQFYAPLVARKRLYGHTSMHSVRLEPTTLTSTVLDPPVNST